MTTHAPFDRHSTARERVGAWMHPLAAIERLAATFERCPGAFFLVMLALPFFIYFSSRGASGILGWPAVPSFVFGTASIVIQCMLFAMIRGPKGSKIALWFFLLLISVWNMTALASGIVSAKPDAMQRHIIARQLKSATEDAADKAIALEGLAARLADLAEFSTAQSTREGAASIKAGYMPTCPGSTGPGEGKITKWRRDTAAKANAFSISFRSAAATARTAANKADRATQAYTVNNHDNAMLDIANAVSEISTTANAANRSGVILLLDALDAETGIAGTCPDATLAGLSQSIRNMPTQALDQTSQFSPPERPSEAAAANDMVTQVANIFHGKKSDLSLYAWPMVGSPIIDVFLMLMLGRLLPRSRLTDDDVEIADRIGIHPEEAPLVDDAFEAVAHDPSWTDLIGKVENAGRGFWRVKRFRIPENDWASLQKMMHYVELGRVRFGNVVDGHYIFVAKSRFFFERFNQLARKHVVASRFQPSTPSKLQPENAL